MGLQGRLIFLDVLSLVGMPGLPRSSSWRVLVSLAILLVALPIVVHLAGQGAIASVQETPKFNSYIIELKNDPLVKYQTTGVRVQAATDAYRATLTSEHEGAKRDILSRLGKKSIASTRKSTGETLELLGEYTGVFNGFALEISEAQAKEVRQSSFVKNVSPNYEIKTSLLQSVPLINADDVWQLTDSQERKVTGEGVTIAILDTGIDYTHADLGGCLGVNCKVIGGYDFVNKDDDPRDDNYHGTHVASIAAGNGSLFKGVAPSAKLVGYKVLNQYGGGWSSDILSALERSADPNQDGDFADHWDIVNMSLGAIRGRPDDPMSVAVDNTVSAGVVVAVAAGNWGGITMDSPGTARKAITVGATDKADSIPWFSARGPVLWDNQSIMKPDLAAPGVDICAAQYDSSRSEKRCTDNSHIALTGTSMATPHVAGAVALIKQKHPNWSPNQIKSALKSRVQNIGGSTAERGSGRVDALLAVNASDSPPVAELNPISMDGNNRVISGKIETQDLKQWSLSYKSFDPTRPDGKWVEVGDWVEVKNSTSLPTNEELGTIQTIKLVDNGYLIRLLVEDIDGESAVDYGFLNVDKLQIRSPKLKDIWREGPKVPLDLVLYEGITPTAWTLGYGSTRWGEPPLRWWPTLGGPTYWNSTGIKNGFYGLQITMEQRFGEKIVRDSEEVYFYLDKALNAVISGTTNIGAGRTSSYQTTAHGDNLAWARIYWAKADSDLTKAKSWTFIGGSDCSKGSATCNATGDFTPPGAGSYWVTAVASDRTLGPCSGNPKWDSVPGWKDCGPTSRLSVQVSSRACIQVITPAKNDQTGECREFLIPCDVPQGWVKVSSCEATPSATLVPTPLPSPTPPVSTPAPTSSSPTGTISGPASGKVGQNLTYTGRGNGSDPQTVSMHWAKTTSDLTRGESWHFIAKNELACLAYAISGLECTAEGVFAPTEAGTYYVSVVVIDNKDGPCSGNPKWDSVPGWKDCGQNDAILLTVSP